MRVRWDLVMRERRRGCSDEGRVDVWIDGVGTGKGTR